MHKRGVLFISLLVVAVMAAGVFAQVTGGVISEETEKKIFSDIGDVSLQEDAGLTPDSALYFLDDFLESLLVGENPERALRYKEEKIAEIKKMVEEGKVEEAKEVLERLDKYADILEKEVSPVMEKRARESSKAAREILEELKGSLEGEEWDEVRDGIKEHSEKEGKIAVAAKISAQISDLCRTLSEIDPLEYSRVCRSDDDSPKWQRELDDDLTEEQKKEAKEFFEIMTECFESSGVQCRCEDIKFSDFAAKCSEMSPLVAACDVNDDEDACDELDRLEREEDPFDLLPEYLQDVLEEVENQFEDSQQEHHMPRECIDAGATDRRSCERVMFRANAPPECVEAFDRGELEIGNEREAREACERIMFKQNAPQECIDAGLTDFRECGVLMFKQNAPQECIDAGLTGEHRSDERECRKIMEDFDGGRFEGPRGGFGANCREIDDSEERLRCYDGAVEGVGEHIREEGNWPGPCREAEAFTPESCRKVMTEFGEREFAGRSEEFNGDFEDGRFEDFDEGGSCGDCASKCEEREGQRLRGTNCVNNQCECFYESDQDSFNGFDSGEREGSEEFNRDFDREFDGSRPEEGFEDEHEESDGGEFTGPVASEEENNGESFDSSGSNSGEDSAGESSFDEGGESFDSSGSLTGGVIFFDKFF